MAYVICLEKKNRTLDIQLIISINYKLFCLVDRATHLSFGMDAQCKGKYGTQENGGKNYKVEVKIRLYHYECLQEPEADSNFVELPRATISDK